MDSKCERFTLEIHGYELKCRITSRNEDDKPKRLGIVAHYPNSWTVVFDYPGLWDTDSLADQYLRERALDIAKLPQR